MADEGRIPIKRALVSVFDKEGIEDLAAALKDLGVSVISTGGTAKKLAAAGESLRLSTHLRSRNPTSTPSLCTRGRGVECAVAGTSHKLGCSCQTVLCRRIRPLTCNGPLRRRP